MLAITGLYAGLIALIFLVLSFRVIIYRRGKQIGLGDAGDKGLIKRMRAHANCAEYAPIGLLLLGLVETQGAPGWVVHGLGLTLLAGRAAHAYGFSARPPVMNLRVGGMLLTTLMIGLSALGLVAHALV